jgi:hypothetical protein
MPRWAPRCRCRKHPGEFAGRIQTLSPTDKRQLLDRIYMGMQAISEHGLAAMSKAGM